MPRAIKHEDCLLRETPDHVPALARGADYEIDPEDLSDMDMVHAPRSGLTQRAFDE